MKTNRPIVAGCEVAGFMPEMIRELRDAVREDRKTQTRRVINFKKLPLELASYKTSPSGTVLKNALQYCPYGKPGEIHALREPLMNWGGRAYYSDELVLDQSWNDCAPVKNCFTGEPIPWRWKVNKLSQRYMPYEAVRTFCRIKDIRAEMLQEITEEDAILEGLTYQPNARRWGTWENGKMENHYDNPVSAFAYLWDFINGKDHPWSQNDMVWVQVFERVKT